MATTFKEQYTAAASITITLNSLANAAARQSTVVDNTANLYQDALVMGTFVIPSGSLGSTPVISLYVYALSDGAHYTDGCTGSDGAFTMPATPNLILAKQVAVNAASSTVYSSPFDVALCFGGVMPSAWGIVVVNGCGLTLNSTGNSLSYQGVTIQGV